MSKNILSYIAVGIGVFILDFILSSLIGEWLGGDTGNPLVPYVSAIFVSILFLTATIVICTLLIIEKKEK